MNFIVDEEQKEKKVHPIWAEKYRPEKLDD